MIPWIGYLITLVAPLVRVAGREKVHRILTPEERRARLETLHRQQTGVLELVEDDLNCLNALALLCQGSVLSRALAP
jgi:hypothetical protein